MMQTFHHQQQQLISLLLAVIPTDGSASSLPSTLTPSASSSPESIASSTVGSNASVPVLSTGQRDGKLENIDSGRLNSLKSLHRAIKYPPNSLLIAHSASFLSSGLLQLLSDKSYDVRQASMSAYGALCAVVCSIPMESSGRQNHVMLGSLVDRFINWDLPLLRHVSVRDESTVLAVEGVREFVSVGDVNGIDRYVLPIPINELAVEGVRELAPVLFRLCKFTNSSSSVTIITFSAT